ncbi:MAG: hypothetical protein P8123_08385 [bacterium]
MSKKCVLVLILLAVALISVAGCRSYGYRPYYAGGPHLDYKPFWPIPVFINHGPVPFEELKEVYPPELNISQK